MKDRFGLGDGLGDRFGPQTLVSRKGFLYPGGLRVPRREHDIVAGIGQSGRKRAADLTVTEKCDVHRA
ncbi:MAG: hypothetical protein R2748_29630 [Bryobacterales bacterium]